MPVFTRAVRAMVDELDLPAEEVIAALEALARASDRAPARLAAAVDDPDPRGAT